MPRPKYNSRRMSLLNYWVKLAMLSTDILDDLKKVEDPFLEDLSLFGGIIGSQLLSKMKLLDRKPEDYDLAMYNEKLFFMIQQVFNVEAGYGEENMFDIMGAKYIKERRAKVVPNDDLNLFFAALYGTKENLLNSPEYKQLELFAKTFNLTINNDFKTVKNFNSRFKVFTERVGNNIDILLIEDVLHARPLKISDKINWTHPMDTLDAKYEFIRAKDIDDFINIEKNLSKLFRNNVRKVDVDNIKNATVLISKIKECVNDDPVNLIF